MTCKFADKSIYGSLTNFYSGPSECSAAVPLALAALGAGCGGRRAAARRSPSLFSPRVGKRTVSPSLPGFSRFCGA